VGICDRMGAWRWASGEQVLSGTDELNTDRSDQVPAGSEHERKESAIPVACLIGGTDASGDYN
jgi:hypothetical protein